MEGFSRPSNCPISVSPISRNVDFRVVGQPALSAIEVALTDRVKERSSIRPSDQWAWILMPMFQVCVARRGADRCFSGRQDRRFFDVSAGQKGKVGYSLAPRDFVCEL